ncbi:hypothetical protein [Halomonas alkaliantarctica]|uniref:hypothetical protein n=1 Tax=Halomonas alkaliantarctica TaxID=232346 RepID=UPI0004ABD0BE|nr:hypothetical protein [Halomonas alkaliantarctica]
MRDTRRRLQALERIGGRHGSSDPARIHEVMAYHGIEAPEPLPGEDTPTWLKRVPSAALEAVLALRGGHAQP